MIISTTPPTPPPPQSQIDLSPLADHSVAEVFGFCAKKQEQARTLINGSKTRLRSRRRCFTKKCCEGVLHITFMF